MTYFLVFLAAFVLDLAYGVYIKTVADGRALTAAVASLIIGALGLYGVSSVVNDGALAIPWLLGLFTSTYLIVRLTNKGQP